MDREDAKEYIKDILSDMNHEEELIKLVIWAYDKGWEEGIEDYREEQDPTEEQVWRASR
jgi:hypothetical protein